MTEEQSTNLSGTLTRRALLQKACMTGAWVAMAPLLAAQEKDGLTPAQQGLDFANEFNTPNWKPLFFSDEQNQTTIALCETILPATQSPGAKQALVNRYIDLVLSAESPETQSAFAASLQYIDDESVRVYGKPFRSLTTDEQVEVLLPMALPMQAVPGTSAADKGYEHFTRVKGMIVEGYYSSEPGDTELGWDGSFSHGIYEGCKAESNPGEKK